MGVGLHALAGAPLPVHVMYPSDAPLARVAFGAYELDAAVDGAVADGPRLPVVAISHGNSATPWVFRELAAKLARAGFAVVLPEHVGNSRSDNRLAGTTELLAVRPRQLRDAFDAAFGDPLIGPSLTGWVAAIGHSIGGYTALALAGGRPVSLPDGEPVAVTRDPRIRALVLLAPATPWFMVPGALAEVTAPILMRTGERDTHAPAACAEIVLRAAAPIDHRVISNAGHFSFVDEFPAAMVHADFPPSQDPPGFDRAAFLPGLHADILRFLAAPA